MRIILLSLPVLLIAFSATAQNHGFAFGTLSNADFAFTVYEADTSAQAVVLDEFGEAYIDREDLNKVILQRHFRIKILKPGGLRHANQSIVLYNSDKGREEIIRSVKASAFNLAGGVIKETKLESSKVFTERINKRYSLKKFAVPDVRVGTVIEIAYELESPFTFNFRTWEFQDEIPKVRSEFWASYPANYEYNITLKGFQKLSKNENELIRECVGSRASLAGAADCVLLKYAMTAIPAFVEEDFMVAKSNFLSAINFELAALRHFSGRVDKITREWRDAELELRQESRFGIQLKRGKDIVDEHVELAAAGETDPLVKARKIYELIKGWYQWDDVYGIFSEQGIKKAFSERKGNVGDINLSLIAALRYGGFDVDPVILSTRENGFPTEIHPVLSDFNYVVARLKLGETYYLLDATDDFLPFGMIPERCINGKGRVLGEKQSFWIDMAPTSKSRQVTMVNLKLGTDGRFTGKIQSNYSGYAALQQRKRIYSHSSRKEYADEVNTSVLKLADIKSYELYGVDSIYKPLVEVFDIELDDVAGSNATHLVLSPFIIERWDANPFKSQERLYPVDFGVPIDETVIVTIDFPADFKITDLPKRVAVALPNAGGRFIYESQLFGNQVVIKSALSVARTIYTSTEYHYLKELFNHVVSAQSTDLVLERR